MEKEYYITQLEKLGRRKPLDVESFQELVLGFYRCHGRRFPWRSTRNPYRILVSEVMLQQTQTDRVISRYRQFLLRFPSCAALARASLQDVILEWEGLGYYRRARNLHATANKIRRELRGRIPSVTQELQKLPGIGAYTAAAVGAFAFGNQEPLIETNIRTVYLHLFWGRYRGVADATLLRMIERTMYRKDIRAWYYALMDLGVVIKQIRGNPNIRSKHHRRQSAYVGSKREARATILRHLLKYPGLKKMEMRDALPNITPHLEVALSELLKEGFVLRNSLGKYSIP